MAKRNINITPELLKAKLAQRLEQEKEAKALPEFKLERILFDKQLEFIRDSAPFRTAVCSRRCLAEGTLVKTINGPIPIEKLQIGDWVFNEFGKPIRVNNVFYNGEKEVVALNNNGSTLVECTDEHEFLTVHNRINGESVKKVASFYKGIKIKRAEVLREGGISVPQAYGIGAMIGDGCCIMCTSNIYYISSSDESVVKKTAESFSADGYQKCPSDNFTWKIYGIKQDEYKSWYYKKKAHEKIVNVEEILKWDLESRLNFIAGLIDTDGCVRHRDNRLSVSLSMQAKAVIEAFNILVFDLIEKLPHICTDNREKYKNGPVFTAEIHHNYFSRRLLKLLDTHLTCSRKKYKSEYNSLKDNNFSRNGFGVTKGTRRISKVYDISVESFSNLYVLANGLITHNCGKTIVCAAHLIETILTVPRINCLYIAITRISAKNIIWKELNNFNNDYKLGLEFNNADLTISNPKNGSMIYITGRKACAGGFVRQT